MNNQAIIRKLNEEQFSEVQDMFQSARGLLSATIYTLQFLYMGKLTYMAAVALRDGIITQTAENGKFRFGFLEELVRYLQQNGISKTVKIDALNIREMNRFGQMGFTYRSQRNGWIYMESEIDWTPVQEEEVDVPFYPVSYAEEVHNIENLTNGGKILRRNGKFYVVKHTNIQGYMKTFPEFEFEYVMEINMSTFLRIKAELPIVYEQHRTNFYRFYYESGQTEMQDLTTLKTDRGSWIKRYASLYFKQTNKKLEPDVLVLIEKYLKQYNPGKYKIVLSQRLDWEAGDFGDEGSCWWDYRGSHMAESLFTCGKGWAIKVFDTKKRRIGRCFAFFDDDSLYLFNNRNRELSFFRDAMLYHLPGSDSKKVELNVAYPDHSYVDTDVSYAVTYGTAVTSKTMEWR